MTKARYDSMLRETAGEKLGATPPKPGLTSDWIAWGVPFDPPSGTRQEDQERRYETEFIGGGSPEGIAKEWAEQFDRASVEYAIVNGEDYLVVVENLHTRERWTYRVSGESRPVYRLRDVRAAAADRQEGRA